MIVTSFDYLNVHMVGLGLFLLGIPFISGGLIWWSVLLIEGVI